MSAGSAARAGHLRNTALNAIGRATFMAPVAKAAREVRAGLGLPPVPIRGLEFGLSRYLHVQLCPRGFEYPRSDLPPYVHFVGAPVPPVPAKFEQPSWWPRLSESAHVVLVTQGTIATDPAELLAPCLEGLAGCDLFVVATTGAADPAVLGDPPPNAVVERFVPYSALLPYVDVMVSNGGFGSVQLAIAHGVPMVVADISEDKREVTAHVGWSGAGINLRTDHPSPKVIAGAVQRVLNEPGFRDHPGVASTDSRHQPGEVRRRPPRTPSGYRQRAAPNRKQTVNAGRPSGDGDERPAEEQTAFKGLTPKNRRYGASVGGSPRSRMRGAITHLIAGVPVSGLGAAIDWYTRLFGRPPDLRAGEEILWDIDEHATLFIEPDAARAGAGRVTLIVAGLDALLERLASEGIGHEPIETYSNGVRHVKVPDPDGNAIALAELPQS